jgi:Mn2+/Fe2+ NRAMP family transporter
MHWRGSLDDRPRVAPKFYGVLAAAVVIGMILNYTGANAVKMLFWAAVVNGALSSPLIVLITMLTSDKKVMGECTSSRLLRVLGWITAVVMFVATVAMFIF